MSRNAVWASFAAEAAPIFERDQVPADVDTYPAVAPDLVVEVASRSQAGPLIEDKTALYLAAGVHFIWAIDPARRTIRVHHADGSEAILSEAVELEGGDVLPGFRFPVKRLFA